MTAAAWCASTLAATAVAVAVNNLRMDRRQRRELERLERARIERAERFLAAQLVNQINNERRRTARGEMPDWYRNAKTLQAFRDQLAQIPETDEPTR